MTMGGYSVSSRPKTRKPKKGYNRADTLVVLDCTLLCLQCRYSAIYPSWELAFQQRKRILEDGVGCWCPPRRVCRVLATQEKAEIEKEYWIAKKMPGAVFPPQMPKKQWERLYYIGGQYGIFLSGSKRVVGNKLLTAWHLQFGSSYKTRVTAPNLASVWIVLKGIISVSRTNPCLDNTNISDKAAHL